MNNPRTDIAGYLASLNRKFSVKGNRLEMEDSSIEFEPTIDAAECTGITMRMASKADAAAFHNTATLVVLLDKVMGPSFVIDSFLEKLNQPSGAAFSAQHDGVSVSVEPNTNPWVIAFKHT